MCLCSVSADVWCSRDMACSCRLCSFEADGELMKQLQQAADAMQLQELVVQLRDDGKLRQLVQLQQQHEGAEAAAAAATDAHGSSSLGSRERAVGDGPGSEEPAPQARQPRGVCFAKQVAGVNKWHPCFQVDDKNGITKRVSLALCPSAEQVLACAACCQIYRGASQGGDGCSIASQDVGVSTVFCVFLLSCAA